jgi:hypothetical protein
VAGPPRVAADEGCNQFQTRHRSEGGTFCSHMILRIFLTEPEFNGFVMMASYERECVFII